MLVCCALVDTCLRAVVAWEIYCFAIATVMSDVVLCFLELNGSFMLVVSLS